MSHPITVFQPLTQTDIDAFIATSCFPHRLKQTLSNHFVALDRPVAVSIGVNHIKAIDAVYDYCLIYEILKSYGFCVARNECCEAADVRKILVSSKGIKLPFMSPTDALRATVEIHDILSKHGIDIVGMALPYTEEALCQPAEKPIEAEKSDITYIDVAAECKADKKIQKKLKKQDVRQFIIERINEATHMETVDVHSLHEKNRRAGYPHIFRGGTLGNKPYAVLSAHYNKGCAYMTHWIVSAMGYATGLQAKYLPVEISRGTVLSYGFVYEFEAAADQNYYADYAIEGAKNKIVPSLDPDSYETPGFSYRNKFIGMYLVLTDGDIKNARLVKITDDNGIFIHENWALFAEMHNPRVRENKEAHFTEYELKRIIKQCQLVGKNQVVSFRKVKASSVLDLSKYDEIDYRGINLTDYKKIKFSKKVSGLSEAQLSKQTILDVSACEDVDMMAIDLSAFRVIGWKKKATF